MSPPDLATLQHDFLHYLTTDDPAIAACITATAKVSTLTRLRIYQHAYGVRLTEALQDNFPVLHTLLGAEDFAELARLYIHHYPSQHFSLRYFGDRLSTLLSEATPYQQQPWLAEMAAFEWTVWAAFDAADAPVASLADLQAVPVAQWPELAFSLHPSCQLLSLHWNVPPIWQSLHQAANAEPPTPQHSAPSIIWLVWRQELRTYFRSLSADEAWALQQIQQGQQHRFAELCAGLGERIGDAQATAAIVGFLQLWLQDGIISRAAIA